MHNSYTLMHKSYAYMNKRVGKLRIERVFFECLQRCCEMMKFDDQ